MPQTRSSGPAADQTQPPPPKRTRKRKQPPSSSATPTLTTPSTTEFNAMKDQMNALTTATQSIQRSLAAILPPAATSQAPAGTSTTSPTGHPTLPPTLLDGATGTHADPLVAAILGNDLVNDKSKNTSTPDERTETITPRSPFLLSSPLTLPRLALAFTPSPSTPSTRSPSSSSTTSQSIPTGFCFQYHKPNGQCFKHYKHYCFKCSGPHKAPLCTKSPSLSAPRKHYIFASSHTPAYSR
ncbi:mucin-2-like [Branchiostoma floridae]|uniref:Mucin-2-like n=1 Tax=Branchiostoma floridae TaxID=7739 RepID=A0A9J7MA30_BRAFL|nr:mucin-2-like [Branchiostoma floridae]